MLQGLRAAVNLWDKDEAAEWMRDDKKQREWKTVRARESKHVTANFTLQDWQSESLGQECEIQLAWKELRQLLFSQSFGRLSKRCPRQNPAMWCWKNAWKTAGNKVSETSSLFGKIDETRKSGNFCKGKKNIKKCVYKLWTGSALQ